MNQILLDSRDTRYVLFEMLAVDKLNLYEKYSGHDRQIYEDTLHLAEKIAAQQFYPVNAEGDHVGVSYDRTSGAVTTPESFKPAYQAMAQAGFIGVSADPDFGGLGMPLAVSVACKEYFCSACGSLTFYALLTGSAAQLVHSFGTQQQKRLYLPQMLSGAWGGTMCLTEPDAGSEVGNVKTRAIPQENGAYLISGQKIFISGGEHDLADNIIHMVLARIDGDPPGTRGLSLFIVPKHIPASDGTPPKRNDLICTGIEHKMGIHGLSTCTLSFGENGRCAGYLLGDRRKGMRQMFQMMNEERLFVGLQGLAFSSAAYMHAAAYAKNRLQGARVTELLNPEAPQAPIIEHPDVKRMLLRMKSYTEGMRILTYYLGKNLDVAALNRDEAGREAKAMTELLTPLCKAGNTDTAWDITAESIQIHGGYGYCQDYPVEQYARECKILSIVEGTNGIQSIDLLMRKVLMDKNQYNLTIFKKKVRETLCMADDLVDDKYRMPIQDALEKLDDVVAHLFKQSASGNLPAVFGQATPFQKALFMLCMGWMHLWNMVVATSQLNEMTETAAGDSRHEKNKDNSEALFYRGKILASRFFIGTEFPKYASIAGAIVNNESALIEADAPVFPGAL
ncbi:MAG: acyl-CoA dehydrogenase [Smithella sp.]|jgi:alkylation response protein AidB-like acyl-CoA dehydrogenase